jgi:hypothetical protein
MMHCRKLEGGTMRKPDDDLKIDISDLFGGDLGGPSEALEEGISETNAPAKSQAPVETSPEAENKFQLWIESRNAELEAKSQELEQKIQQAPDTLSGNELQSVSEQEEVPGALNSNSPVDFNTLVAPPFTGPVVSPSVQQSAEGSSASNEAAPPPVIDVEAMKKIQAEYEFLMLYDEFRNIVDYELKDLVGEKKSHTMLGRTVELAREKYPDIFRNANWDASGNLLEDGSVDSQRIIDNKNTLDPQKADAVLDAALSTLLRLRLQAVEKGLGTGLKNKVRAHLYQWISEKTQKAGREGKDTTNLKRLSSYVAST